MCSTLTLQAHVAALRFYTTAGFKTINNGLRDQQRYGAGRPHPLPVTVAFIKEALGRLRAVAGKSRQANTELILYRGMRGMKVHDNFLQRGRGGTELAPMSTTSDPAVALAYAVSARALVLKVKSENFMDRGADISWCSAFPGEKEYLYPPLTYLKPTGRREVVREGDAEFEVVEVAASYGS